MRLVPAALLFSALPALVAANDAQEVAARQSLMQHSEIVLASIEAGEGDTALLAGTLAAMLAAFPLLFPEPGADAIPSSAAPAIWQRPGDFYALAARAVTEARVIAEGDAEAPAKLRETCAACHADFLHFDPFGATKTADN
mgnify:CR=1 FL=1